MKMFSRKLRSARELSLMDWGMLLRAWTWLVLVDLGLRILPFTRLQHMVLSPSVANKHGDPNEDLFRIKHIWRLVDIASRYHLYKMSCLRRSLVLQRLLSRQGFVTELCFGVKKEDGKLQAHAWLEFDGQPIGEPETLTEHYATLAIKNQDQGK